MHYHTLCKTEKDREKERRKHDRNGTCTRMFHTPFVKRERVARNGHGVARSATSMSHQVARTGRAHGERHHNRWIMSGNSCQKGKNRIEKRALALASSADRLMSTRINLEAHLGTENCRTRKASSRGKRADANEIRIPAHARARMTRVKLGHVYDALSRFALPPFVRAGRRGVSRSTERSGVAERELTEGGEEDGASARARSARESEELRPRGKKDARQTLRAASAKWRRHLRKAEKLAHARTRGESGVIGAKRDEERQRVRRARYARPVDRPGRCWWIGGEVRREVARERPTTSNATAYWASTASNCLKPCGYGTKFGVRFKGIPSAALSSELTHAMAIAEFHEFADVAPQIAGIISSSPRVCTYVTRVRGSLSCTPRAAASSSENKEKERGREREREREKKRHNGERKKDNEDDRLNEGQRTKGRQKRRVPMQLRGFGALNVYASMWHASSRDESQAWSLYYSHAAAFRGCVRCIRTTGLALDIVGVVRIGRVPMAPMVFASNNNALLHDSPFTYPIQNNKPYVIALKKKDPRHVASGHEVRVLSNQRSSSTARVREGFLQMCKAACFQFELHMREYTPEHRKDEIIGFPHFILPGGISRTICTEIQRGINYAISYLMECSFKRYRGVETQRVHTCAFCTRENERTECLVDCERASATIRRYAINREYFLAQLASLQNNAGEMYDFTKTSLILALNALKYTILILYEGIELRSREPEKKFLWLIYLRRAFRFYKQQDSRFRNERP
ncbi:hypothetical protein DBV15_02971 [Temnothorax longispinosus]|uniref:Uncharacterized protein n=1 Tax=Temnothorax longispinosus TaxID=300112 RepID=A0A4S2JNG6_9HYME|nr:hypothetical protein DBV15_02971 [Temnothorax longispinosus]